MSDIKCQNYIHKYKCLEYVLNHNACEECERRVRNPVVEELEKIKEEILEYHCIKCYGTCKTHCPYSDCIEPKDVIEDLKIIDKHITELKGENDETNN